MLKSRKSQSTKDHLLQKLYHIQDVHTDMVCLPYVTFRVPAKTSDTFI